MEKRSTQLIKKPEIQCSFRAILLAMTFLFFNRPAAAGYMVVNLKSCHTNDSSPTCIAPISNDDPNSTRIYELILRNEWPTSIGYPSEHNSKEHEEIRLNKEVEKEFPDQKYKLIWIPDTIHELFITNFTLENSDKFLMKTGDRSGGLQHQHGPYHLLPYSKDRPPTLEEQKAMKRGFNPLPLDYLADTNKKVKEIVKTEVDPVSELTSYYKDLNVTTKEPYFEINVGLFNFLHQRGLDPLKITQNDEKNDYETSSLKGLRQTLVKQFRTLYLKSDLSLPRKYGKRTNINGFTLPETETELETDTILDRIINLEVAAHKSNQALLFRGTNGYKGFLDSADTTEHPIRKSPCGSLAFGASIWGGYFLDSQTSSSGRVNESSACALQYILDNKLSYALKIDKNEFMEPHGEAQKLIFVPNLGHFGRVFGTGEYFHPRTRVGSKEVIHTGDISGLLFGTTATHVKAKVAFSDEFTPTEMSKKVDHYIAKHAEILTIDHKPVLENDIRAIELLSKQITHSERQNELCNSLETGTLFGK